jgi:hypothetical protein
MAGYEKRITPLLVLLLGACSHLLEPPAREQVYPLQIDRLERSWVSSSFLLKD